MRSKFERKKKFFNHFVQRALPWWTLKAPGPSRGIKLRFSCALLVTHHPRRSSRVRFFFPISCNFVAMIRYRLTLSEHKECDLKTFLEIMPRKRTLISKDAVKKAMAVLEKHGNGGTEHLLED